MRRGRAWQARCADLALLAFASSPKGALAGFAAATRHDQSAQDAKSAQDASGATRTECVLTVCAGVCAGFAVFLTFRLFSVQSHDHDDGPHSATVPPQSHVEEGKREILLRCPPPPRLARLDGAHRKRIFALAGDATLAQAAQGVLTAVLAATIRHGIVNK